MKDLNSNAMNKAVKEAISLCGIEVLTDANRFHAAMKDFMRNMATEQYILAFAVKVGIGEMLLRGYTKSDGGQKRAISAANKLLSNEFGFQKIRCDEILAAFTSAIEWYGTNFPKDQKLDPGLRKQKRDTSPVETKGQEATVDKNFIDFGNYRWRILTLQGNSALVVSEEITDIGIPFNTAIGDISWESSSLRKWLNDQFYNRFSKTEKKRIIKKRLRAEPNPWYGTAAGNLTEDSIFLLSVAEVIAFFGDSGDLSSRPQNQWVDEVIANGQSVAIDDSFNAVRCATYKGDKTWWWLRTPGASKNKVTYVNAEGIILLNGELAFNDGGTSCVGVRPGIRPAIWLQV